jgi:hypothetical protein
MDSWGSFWSKFCPDSHPNRRGVSIALDCWVADHVRACEENIKGKGTSLEAAEKLGFALAFGWRSGLPLRQVAYFRGRL